MLQRLEQIEARYEELANEQVALGNFDLMTLFKTAFEAEGVPEPFQVEQHMHAGLGPYGDECGQWRELAFDVGQDDVAPGVYGFDLVGQPRQGATGLGAGSLKQVT